MKTVFSIALLSAVATADWINQVQRYHGFLESTFGLPVTRRDALNKFHPNHKRQFKKHPNHEMIMEQATHSVRAQRVRLGLPKIAAGDGDSESSYENLEGFLGRTLGIFQGMQYSTSGGGNSACFTAIESLLLASQNAISLMPKVILPWYSSEVQLVTQDFIALNAGWYTDCEVSKFFNTMTGLASSEGLSEMGARGSGSYMFEYKSYKKLKADPNATSFQKGKSFGALFAIIVDYHI